MNFKTVKLKNLGRAFDGLVAHVSHYKDNLWKLEYVRAEGSYLFFGEKNFDFPVCPGLFVSDKCFEDYENNQENIVLDGANVFGKFEYSATKHFNNITFYFSKYKNVLFFNIKEKNKTIFMKYFNKDLYLKKDIGRLEEIFSSVNSDNFGDSVFEIQKIYDK